MRNGNFLKIRVIEIRVKQIRVNQGLGVYFTHAIRTLEFYFQILISCALSWLYDICIKTVANWLCKNDS